MPKKISPCISAATAVCTENLVQFDLMTESPNVGRDDRIPPVPTELAWLAAAVQSPVAGGQHSRLQAGSLTLSSASAAYLGWLQIDTVQPHPSVFAQNCPDGNWTSGEQEHPAFPRRLDGSHAAAAAACSWVQRGATETAGSPTGRGH
jgi:hypothetical protein